MDQLVIVTGISLKGKNRIRERGETWKVIRELEDKILLSSLDDKYLRWVDKQNDEDFTYKCKE